MHRYTVGYNPLLMRVYTLVLGVKSSHERMHDDWA